MACPGHAVLGRVIPKTLRTTNLQSITTKCKQRLSLGRSLGRPCPRRHALGMLSLAGSVPAPCERRTYTGKHNPNIMQWGWELSQQLSSGEFRQTKVCNQKGQKGSIGQLGEQTKAARIGVICQGASSAPHFLLARLQGYSFQFVFQLVFPAYTLQLPSCVLPTVFKTFCSNKLGILTGTSWHSAFKTFCSTKLGILSGRRWHFSNVSSDITGPPAHESTSLDVNKANGMLTSHAKRIFSGNVTCFEKKQKLLE